MQYELQQIMKWSKDEDSGGFNRTVVLELCEELQTTRKEFIEILRRVCSCRCPEDDGLCDFCHLRIKYEEKK